MRPGELDRQALRAVRSFGPVRAPVRLAVRRPMATRCERFGDAIESLLPVAAIAVSVLVGVAVLA